LSAGRSFSKRTLIKEGEALFLREGMGGVFIPKGEDERNQNLKVAR